MNEQNPIRAAAHKIVDRLREDNSGPQDGRPKTPVGVSPQAAEPPLLHNDKSPRGRLGKS